MLLDLLKSTKKNLSELAWPIHSIAQLLFTAIKEVSHLTSIKSEGEFV